MIFTNINKCHSRLLCFIKHTSLILLFSPNTNIEEIRNLRLRLMTVRVLQTWMSAGVLCFTGHRPFRYISREIFAWKAKSCQKSPNLPNWNDAENYFEVICFDIIRVLLMFWRHIMFCLNINIFLYRDYLEEYVENQIYSILGSAIYEQTLSKPLRQRTCLNIALLIYVSVSTKQRLCWVSSDKREHKFNTQIHVCVKQIFYVWIHVCVWHKCEHDIGIT